MAVRTAQERKTEVPSEPDSGPVEVHPPGVKGGELDGIEKVDFLKQSAAQGDRDGKEGVGGYDQPLGALESPEVGEGLNTARRNVEVVEEHVPPLDRGLHPGDQQDPPLPGVDLQILAKRDGVVVGDAEDMEAPPCGAINETEGIVGDKRLALTSVKMQIGL